MDQFQAWREALANGKTVEYTKGSPTAGYFKRRARNEDRSLRFDAVGIWFEDGEWFCQASAGYTPRKADEIEELFVNCNSSPITYELFEAIMAGGAWPEELKSYNPSKVDVEPHEAAAAELALQQAAAREWATSLKDADGKARKPSNQSEADHAANFSDTFGKIEKRVTGLHEVEKRPIIDAGKVIDAKWFVIRDAAKTAKVWAKGLSDDFAISENARRKREADEENSRRLREFEEAQARAKAEADERAALVAKGVRAPDLAPLPPMPELPKVVTAEPVRVGTTGRRQSLRKVPTYKISDATAMLHWMADRNLKSQKLLEAALEDAKALHEVGVEVPGLVVGSKDEMR